MTLQEYVKTLPEAQYNLQVGMPSENPLKGAFPSKRVVHAGLNGEMVSPLEVQQKWQDVMSNSAQRGQLQTAYIHIPFCKTKCTYCGFFQNGTNQSVEDTYIDRLIKELSWAKQWPRIQEGLIQAVFIGGGTPTSLSVHNVTRLLQAIRENLPLSNDYELTLEGRIHDITDEKVEAWMANGVNRVSVGVQSFDTQVRQSVGRLDTKEEIFKRLALLKQSNQCSIVIDLIYGLPGQTMDIWEEDLRLLVESGVDGVDLYQLNVFSGSDLNRDITSGKVPPAATTEEQTDMFLFGREFLQKRHYRRLSAAHWSIGNRERSWYNSLAKAGVPMFAFGCGAGGNVDGYGMMQHRTLQVYNDMLDNDEKPIMAMMAQPAIQPIINAVIKSLESGHLDLHKLIAMDARLQELEWLYNLWQDRGLVQNNGIVYSLTAAGEFWCVNITQSTLEFIEYILTGKNSFALESIAAQDDSKQAKSIEVKTDTEGPQGIGLRGAHIETDIRKLSKKVVEEHSDMEEAQRKEKIMAIAKAEIEKSNAPKAAQMMMFKAMENLGSEELLYMMQRMTGKEIHIE